MDGHGRSMSARPGAPQNGMVRRRHGLVEADVALHPPDVRHLVGLDEGHDDTAPSGARRTTRSVDVGLVIGGRVVVDDRADVVDMDAARGHIGGDQGLRAAGDEVVEGAAALLLVAPTVDRAGADAALGQLAGETVGAVPCPAEDDRRRGRLDDAGAELDAIGRVDFQKRWRARERSGVSAPTW